MEWLSANGYQIVSVPAGSWQGPSDLHRDISQALDFPGYYGKNLDALNDCLRDVALGDYGLDRRATGFVLVLTEFDRFAAVEPVGAHALLDIFAERARNAALFGQIVGTIPERDRLTNIRVRFPDRVRYDRRLGNRWQRQERRNRENSGKGM